MSIDKLGQERLDAFINAEASAKVGDLDQWQHWQERYAKAGAEILELISRGGQDE